MASNNLRGYVEIAKNAGSKMVIGIGFVLTKKNLSEVELLLELASSLGVYGVDFQFLTLDGRAACNWQTVGYTVEEALESTEKIALAQGRYSNIVLQVDCRPLFTRYIWKKYGIDLSMSPFAMRCKGSSFHYYMRADGEMHPCGPCDTKLAEIAISKRCFIPQKLNIKEMPIDEILNSSYFVSFFKYANDSKTYRMNKTCRDCEYNLDCRPCPLLSESEGNGLIDECEWTKERINELDKEMLSKSSRIKKETRWIKQNEKVYIFDMKKGDFVAFEGIGSDVWNLFDRNLLMSDIIESLYPMYSNNVDKRTFKKDILDFVYDIKNRGYIE